MPDQDVTLKVCLVSLDPISSNLVYFYQIDGTEDIKGVNFVFDDTCIVRNMIFKKLAHLKLKLKVVKGQETIATWSHVIQW
jgi:hypothetical protein